MKKINVYPNKGSDLQQDKSFDSIVWLNQKGYTEKGAIIFSSQDTIQTPSFEFVKSRPNKDADTQSAVNLDKDSGASWFACLRGEEKTNELAIWQMFIEKIADYFHKEYSLLEYAPISLSKTPERVEADKRNIGRVISYFADRMRTAEIYLNDTEGNKDDIYGATLRLQVTDGTGEAKPALCKIFFRNKDDEKGIEPVLQKDVSEINKSVKAFANDMPSEINTENFSRDETVISIMNALDDLLKEEDGFQDYVSFEDERDKSIIEAIIKRGPDNVVPILCRSVDVISVFHAKWAVRNYTVELDGRQTFDATVGIGDKISVSCKLCRHNRKLIDNNKVKITDGDITKYILINPEDVGLGLDEEDAELILENNPFDEHALEIVCYHSRFDDGICKKYTCQTKLFDVDQDLYASDVYDRKSKLCKDCPNLEVVYRIGDECYHTPQLVFSHDKMTLTTRDNVQYCRVCERAYNSDLGDERICDFCQTAISDTAENKNSFELYEKYSEMLPLADRLLGIRKEKRCVEDADIIILRIGDRVLLFNKKFEKSAGYIKAYKKYRLRG